MGLIFQKYMTIIRTVICIVKLFYAENLDDKNPFQSRHLSMGIIKAYMINSSTIGIILFIMTYPSYKSFEINFTFAVPGDVTHKLMLICYYSSIQIAHKRNWYIYIW